MISFENAYLEGIDVNDKSLLLSTFHKQGFAIIAGESFPDNHHKAEDKLLYIERKYRLGRFKASDDSKRLYSERLKEKGFNNIGRPGVDVKLPHEAFDTNSGQDFHVDGIFQPTGSLKTIVLTCKNQALEGGYNTLFNMHAAIEHIRSIDPDMLTPLFDKRSMRRIADYEGSDRHMCDSVLQFCEEYQRLEVNFSVDRTVDWAFSEKLVPNIKRPIEILKHLTTKGEPYTLKVLIKTGDTIMMDNGLIAHGRTDFVDTADAPRIMVRGKYEVLPS